MATSLRLVFGANAGKKVSIAYNYADATCGNASVKSLMQTIIANGEIFAEPPLSIVGAEFVSTIRQTANVS
jgi:hypothetical protein